MITLESLQDRLSRIIKSLKKQPKSRLIVALLLMGAIFYVLFLGGYDNRYNVAIEREIEISKIICEHSYQWVMARPERLKMGKNELKDMKIPDLEISLKHVEYPHVLFLDSGIRSASGKSGDDLFCTFTDPRSRSTHYYFNYKTRAWVDGIRFRS